MAAAQDQIDRAPEPKPLPVAALFKAYDEILPQHGVDPDSDQHLSAFIFRVGGEVGDGTLVEKYQTVLARMGIVLEFGEDTTRSFDNSPSPVSSGSLSTRSLSPVPLQSHKIASSQPVDVVRRPLGLIATAQPGVEHGEVSEDHGAEPRPAPGAENLLQSARRASLSSAMNRWRNAAARSQRSQGAASLATSLRSSSLEVNANSRLPDPARFLASMDGQHLDPGAKNLMPRAKQAGGENVDEQGPVPRPSVISSVDQWRLSVSHPSNQDRSETGIVATAQEHLPIDPKKPQLQDDAVENKGPRGHGIPVQSIPTTVPPPDVGATSRMETSFREDLESRMLPYFDTSKKLAIQNTLQRLPSPPPNTAQERAAFQLQEERLRARAARAREIYLASQAFNHWADRTARRLEREAVARRHMIRFRCFRGWSQIPSSRTPVVEHLRASTAAQKLRRAVAQHEEQLQLVASAAAEGYHLKLVHDALRKWVCHFLEQETRRRIASQSRMRTITRWMLHTGDDADVDVAVTAHRRRANNTNALIRWRTQAEKCATRQEAASEIGSSHLSMIRLRGWWDQAEADRRALVYRHHRLLAATYHSLDLWNLQTRADAFVGRNQYHCVLRIFRFWAEESRIHSRRKLQANTVSERMMKGRFVRQLEHIGHDSRALQRLETRAGFYIRATRLVSTLERAVARRKVQEKESLKRYLMMRYQQVSRDRKKRNFFAALDHWTSLTDSDRLQASRSETMKSRGESSRRMAVVVMWSQGALDGQQLYYDAQLYHSQLWLEMWSVSAMDDEQRYLSARALWTSEKQRQYQKVWSISTLQQGAQSHMVASLCQRHDRHKRSRAAQRWRQRCSKSKNVTFGQEPDIPTNLGSSGIFRSSWRASSARRPFPSRRDDRARQIPGPVDTPTRWTGQLFPMGSAMSTGPMPAVKGAEQYQATHSSIGGDEDVPSPTRPSIGPTTPGLPTTTPRGPVPAHLEPSFGPRSARPPALSRVVQRQDGFDRSWPSRRDSGVNFPGLEQGREVTGMPHRRPEPATVDKPRTSKEMSDVAFTTSTKSRSVGALSRWQYAASPRQFSRRPAAEPTATQDQMHDELTGPLKQSSPGGLYGSSAEQSPSRRAG